MSVDASIKCSVLVLVRRPSKSKPQHLWIRAWVFTTRFQRRQLGVRHKNANARGFIDLTYARRRPVPEQVGESNYVDNDKVGLMAGADIALKLRTDEAATRRAVFRESFDLSTQHERRRAHD